MASREKSIQKMKYIYSALMLRHPLRQVRQPLALAAVALLLSPSAVMAAQMSSGTSARGAAKGATQLAQVPNLGGGVVAEDYLLGPGDRVRIDFFNVPELSGEFQVLPNGTINVPQVGSVPVRAKTLSQAENLIGARAASLLRYPVVTVSLISARPISIAVAGEVNQPGSYSVSTDNTATAIAVPTLTRMLKQAQGVTQSADLSQIKIRRPGAQGTQLISVNLWDLIQQGDISQDLRLRDGDSVFVPAAATINPDLAWQLADAEFATSPNKPLTISVVGEVNRPGPHTITGEASRDLDGNVVSFRAPTIARAIQVAGGITQSANVRKITVKRVTRTGPLQQTDVNFWELLKTGDFRQDLPLQDGDTIVIAEATSLDESEITDIASASFSPAEIQVNVAGEVERPGLVALQPNAPLNQALLTAGGYNSRAKTGQVTLLRLNPNGSVEKREIDVDLGADVNSAQNPPLRDGDTLVIARSRFSTATGIFGDVLRPITGGFGFFNIIKNLFFDNDDNN